MFTAHGLVNITQFRFERALLSIGDYFLPSGRRNISFLSNPPTEQASWKRLLRGTGPKVPEARSLFQKLLDRIRPRDIVSRRVNSPTSGNTSRTVTFLMPTVYALFRLPPPLLIGVHTPINRTPVDEQLRMRLLRGGNVPHLMHPAMDRVIGSPKARSPRRQLGDEPMFAIVSRCHFVPPAGCQTPPESLNHKR